MYTQGLEDVINHLYVLIGALPKELCYEKQKYMFQIFLTNLLTDKGKEIVRKYNKTFDVQSIWKEYSTHYMKYTADQVNTDLIVYITSVCIDAGSRRAYF